MEFYLILFWTFIGIIIEIREWASFPQLNHTLSSYKHNYIFCSNYALFFPPMSLNRKTLCQKLRLG